MKFDTICELNEVLNIRVFAVIRVFVSNGRLSRHKRHKRHNAGFFDGVGENSLVLSASSMTFWWINFPLGIHKTADEIGIFEIDFFNPVLAEMTEFFLHHADFIAVAIVIHTLNLT
jgi:hypothetical protein